MKSSRVKKILAVILCLTLGLSTNMITMAESVNSPAVESVQQDQAGSEQAAADAAALQTMSVESSSDTNQTEAAQPTEAPEPTPEVTAEPTAVPTEAPTPEATAEPTQTPAAATTETPQVTEVPAAEAVPTQGAEETEISIQTQIDDTLITMSGPESSFPEGQNYEIVASELDDKAIQDVEVALRKKELEKNVKISTYQAYDIKLVVDGTEMQPNGNVTVTFTGGDISDHVVSAENIDVYHVDENLQTAEDMTNTVKETSVLMETNHFSTYVISTESQNPITVTIEHYLEQGNGKQPTELFAKDTKQITNTTTIDNMSKSADNSYEVSKIVKRNKAGDETEVTADQVITEDTTYRVYYKATTASDVKGDAQFFDYQVQGVTGYGKNKTNFSINDSENYDQNSQANQRISSGTVDQNRTENKYYTYVTVNGTDRNINDYDENYVGGKGVYTGIIEGIDLATGELKMGKNSSGKLLYEPGFFTKSEKTGKQYYDNFDLYFTRNGNKYTLSYVQQEGSRYKTDSGEEFFPLDYVNDPTDEANSSANSTNPNTWEKHNCYFGLRYDIEFSIGEYVGEMNYKFTGDDDLWVVLDGKQVVIDLGGIHGAAPGEIDLWQALNISDKTNLTEAQKNDKHTLTILYMERGAGDSNCQMEYTLPNSKILDVTQKRTADLVFAKVTSDLQPLSGAEFTVQDESGKTVPVRVSGNIFTVSGLLEGNTYTLQETKSPEGYVKNDETYRIKLEDVNGALTAKLYHSDGTTEVAGNQIVNYTEKEEIEKELEYDKSVTTDDGYGSRYEDRTYTLHLTANSKAESEGTPDQTGNIVLVLDRSSSMKNDLSKLKNGAKAFVQEAHENSPISSIEILTFAGAYPDDGNISKSGFIELSDNGVSRLNSFIDKISTASGDNGGTNMGAALEEAYDDIKDRQNGTVVFFTDGRPGYYSQNNGSESYNDRIMNSYIADVAKEYADKLKAENIHIYCIGYGSELDETFYWDSYNGGTIWSPNHNIKGSDFLKNYIASEGKYWPVDADDDLGEIFENLAGEVGEGLAIKADCIIDTIDPRFELTKDAKNKIETWNKEFKSKYGNNKEYITYDSETGTITWQNEAAEIKNGTSDQPGWSYDIQIQAKDDFIGGNMIPTNGVDSGIYLEDGTTAYFPKPTVNVKLLGIKGSQKEEKVFVQDKITPQDKISELQFTIQNEASNEIPEECRLTADDMATLVNSGTVEKQYSYTNTKKDYVGTFTYTLTSGQSTIADHQALSKGATEIYTVTLSYTPYSVNQRTENLGTDYENPVPENQATVNPKTAEAQYKITIVAGKLSIEKKLASDTARNPELEGDPVFTFKITCKYRPQEYEETTETLYRTVRIEEDKDSAVAEIIENLPRGEYTITELETQRYKLQSVADGSGNLTGTASENSITFEIGCGENKDNYTALEGKSVFTNKKTGDSGKRTDTDVVINRFVRQEDGSWKVIVEKVPQNVAGKEAESSVKIEASKETVGMDSGEDQMESGDQ